MTRQPQTQWHLWCIYADLLRVDARLAGRPSGLPKERSPSPEAPSMRLCSTLCVLSSMDCGTCVCTASHNRQSTVNTFTQKPLQRPLDGSRLQIQMMAGSCPYVLTERLGVVRTILY